LHFASPQPKRSFLSYDYACLHTQEAAQLFSAQLSLQIAIIESKQAASTAFLLIFFNLSDVFVSNSFAMKKNLQLTVYAPRKWPCGKAVD
jgi:hypothetical protein